MGPGELAHAAMDNPIKEDHPADQTPSGVSPYDGNIDFAQYSLAQLRELQHTIDARSHPRNFANLLTEIELRQPIEHAAPAAACSFPGRFTERDNLAGWLTARYHKLLVYGSGAIEVGAEGVTVNGWQRTWLGVAEQVSLYIPNAQIRNAAAAGPKVRFEWKRPYRLARIVEFNADSRQLAEALLGSLPTQQTPAFATRWAELRDFNTRVSLVSSPAWITLALILINIAVCIAMFIAHPGGFDLLMLRNWGGNVGLLVINGQWWRLVSALFIHAGLFHILANMWVLWNIGRLTERLYGKWPFCAVYFGSGVIAGLSSVVWDVNHVSVGASGAIFGLFGAYLVFLMRADTRIPTATVRAHWLSTTVFVLFNLIAGFLQAGIDNAAHVGGLLGGFALGWLLARPLEVEARDEFPFKQTVAAAMFVGVCALAMLWQVLGRGSRFSIPEQYFNSRQWYVTGEQQNLKRWQDLAQRAGAQSISTPELGREFARDVVPFWQSTAPRLQQEIASLPVAERPFATLVTRFAQQRLDWAQALAAAADDETHKNWATDAMKLAQQTQMTMARIERLEVRGSLDHRASGLSASPLVVSIRNFFVAAKWQCLESPNIGGQHGIASTDAPSDGPKARRAAACQAQQLFMAGDYRRLDRLIDKYRTQLGDLPDGSSSLAGLMFGLDELIEFGRKDLTDWLSRIADWRRAVPASINPGLAEAMLFRQWAWSARGEAAAKEVSQQAWSAFAYRSEMAQAALEDIADRANANPHWYALAVSVGLDTGKSIEDLREMVDRGKEAYPTYYPLYGALLRALMPRWRGSYDDENRFVNQMSNRWSISPDLNLYARLYWMYSSLEFDEINIFSDGAARWDLMKKGFVSMVASYPHSDAVLNGFAKFACIAGDREQFAKLRPALARRLSASIWSDRVSVSSCDAKFASAPPLIRAAP